MKAKDIVKEVKEAVRRGEKLNFVSPDSLPLTEIFLELTYRCDQRCLMCDVWPRYLKDPGLEKLELSREEIERLILSAPEFQGLKRAVLTGGEPFLRDDLVSICELFLSRFSDLDLILLTGAINTTLLIKKLSEIDADWGLEHLSIVTSLAGIGETHDRVRGHPGAFVALRRSLELLKNKFPCLAISLNFTITPLNYREIGLAFRFAQERGFDFSAQFPIPWPGTQSFRRKKKEIRELKREIYRIIEALIEEGE